MEHNRMSRDNNDNRTPLGDANGNKTVVAVSNPYLTNRSKPQPQQAVVQADENDNNSQPNGASASESQTQTPATAPAPSAPPLHQSSNDTPVSNAIANEPMDEALQLLSSLQRDYQELQKKSVKSCLRSKHFPCPEVSNLLEKSPTQTLPLKLLQNALQNLLEQPEFLGSFQEHKKTQSSLWFMTRLGTAIRFLQLLLVSSQQDPQAKTPMILGLLQTVTATMNESLKIWSSNERSNNKSSEEDDEEETNDMYTGAILDEFYHAPQVATFAVAFLLRTKTLFLNHRPDLLCALWKSVESLVEPLTPHYLSVELLQDAIQGLAGIVKDFLQQLVTVLTITMHNTSNGSAANGPPPAMHPQQLKLASFFLARLSSFLKVALDIEESLEESVLEEIFGLLLRLRGISTAAIANNNDATKLFDSYRKVVAKAEKCIASFLISHTKDQSVDFSIGLRSSNVKLLLGMKHTSENAIAHNMPSEESLLLLKEAFYIGKVESLSQTLLQCLHQQPTNHNGVERVPILWTEEATVNLVLAVCEHLLFDGLPMCHNLFTSHALQSAIRDHSVLDQLLDSCLRCISDALFHCETSAPCMTSNADRGVASLHRLLLRWLLPVNNKLPTLHHPLTRECAVAVVQFHAIRFSQSQASCPSFVALLVKVFFDARTHTCHRATLAVVLRNLLSSQSPTLSQQLQECICTEYGKMRSLRPGLTKRKRDRSGRDKKDDESLQKCWDAFSLEDTRIVGSVLTLLLASTIPNLAVDVERFCLEVVSFSHGKGRSRKLSRNTAKVAILVLGILEAVIREDPTNSSLKNMSGGKDVAEVLQVIISWFLFLWNREFAGGNRKHVDRKRLANLASLGRALLRLLVYNCERNGASAAGDSGSLTEQQMQYVFKLLQVCTDKTQLILSSASEPSKTTPMNETTHTWPCSDGSLTQLVWEASGILGIVVKAFPLSNADSVLQGIVEIFQNLLGPDTCWSFQAHVIGSLHSFSQTLPKTHCHLLSTCIRKKKHKSLLQCRIQGFAFEYEKSNTKDGSKKKSKRLFSSMYLLLNHCSRDLEMLIGLESSMPIQRSVLSASGGVISSAESLSIALGSYFLTMPTQEGRKAIVIFPPEESSLKDIKFMMGPGDELEEGGWSQTTSLPGVQRLRHAMVSQGGSCKMILKPP